MVATSSSDLPDHKKRPLKDNNLEILKGSVFYGANAAGKSNLIKAMDLITYNILRTFFRA